MSQHFRPAFPRGIACVRADATPAALLAELNKAFADFKDENDKRIADLKKGQEDVVRTDKVDRINSAVTDLQKALDQISGRVAAMQVGAGAGANVDPNIAEHAKAFKRFFRSGVDSGLRELEVKAGLRTASDPDGGYVVTPTVEKAIAELARKYSAMRALAQVLTISTADYKKLVNQQGTSSGWVGETDARTETNTAKLAALDFPTFEIYANPSATQTLLDDANIDIESWLAGEVQLEFAAQEGDAFINGAGVVKPRGIVSGYTIVANASYAWGKIGYTFSGGAADFAASNPSDQIIDLIHSLKRIYRQNATFLLNDLTVAKIRKFRDSTGNYLWQPSLQAGAPSQLLGYPAETDDNMPDVGANTYPIAFADFKRAYLVIDRIGTRVLRDPYTNKPYVMFYTTKRVGGGVQNFEAIKLFKIATS